MKKRIIKTVLPLMAFMLATAFAFATDLKSSGDDDLVKGYIFQNNQCIFVDQGCNNLSDKPCKYNVVYPIYRENHTTYCSVPMTHQP